MDDKESEKRLSKWLSKVGRRQIVLIYKDFCKEMDIQSAQFETECVHEKRESPDKNEKNFFHFCPEKLQESLNGFALYFLFVSKKQDIVRRLRIDSNEKFDIEKLTARGFLKYYPRNEVVEDILQIQSGILESVICSNSIDNIEHSSFVGNAPEKCEYTISLYKKAENMVEKSKNISQDELTDILDGICIYLDARRTESKFQKMRKDLSSVEETLLRETIPCWIFLAINMAKNERPSQARKTPGNYQKILKCIMTAFLNLFSESREGKYYDEYYLHKVQDDFLRNEIAQSSTATLSKRDPGTEHFEKENGQISDCPVPNEVLIMGENFIWPCSPECLRFQTLEFRYKTREDGTFEYRETFRDKFPSLVLFNCIISSCKIFREKESAPIQFNHALNILLFNEITNLIYAGLLSHSWNILDKNVYNLPFLANRSPLRPIKISEDDFKNLKKLIVLLRDYGYPVSHTQGVSWADSLIPSIINATIRIVGGKGVEGAVMGSEIS
ncbi:MAG: hypothetical protein KH704_01635 [Clostridiales bacterium]|nr:hypothetical protein [Clostridiales bacterium]